MFTGCSNSVRYFGASAAAFVLTPIVLLNQRWRRRRTGCDRHTDLHEELVLAGWEQMQSILAGRVDELWNWWGAFAGTWSSHPLVQLALRREYNVEFASSRMKASSKS